MLDRQCLAPVIGRAYVPESSVDAFGVIPVDVLLYRSDEVVCGAGVFVLEDFGFQVAEEVFGHGVVQAVASARH